MGALAPYLRPLSKRPRANDIVIETAPVRVGRTTKPKIIAKIPRSGDAAADHALADVVLCAFDLAEAASDLVRDGSVDGFGVFTYSAPPRARMDAVARLKVVLTGFAPPAHPVRHLPGEVVTLDQLDIEDFCR